MSKIKIERKTHKNEANLECVLVIGTLHADNEIRYVTGFGEHNTALWTENEKPYEFLSKSYADEVAYGLCCNGYPAMTMELPTCFTNVKNRESYGGGDE